MRPLVLRTVFLNLSLFLICFSSPAQSNSLEARLSGVLSDPSGYGLNGVCVTASSDSPDPGHTWSATTTMEGSYSLLIPPGRYRVHFVRDSFVERDVTVDLASGENRRLDVRLAIQQLSEKIIVTANAQPIKTGQTPAPVDVVTRAEIDQRQTVLLPELLSIQPGISIARTGRMGGLTTVFLDGGNSSFTKLLVDGTPVNYAGGDFDYSNLTLDNI